MVLGSLRRQLGLEALLGREPRPSAHTGLNDAKPNAGPNDAEPNACPNDAEPNASADDSVSAGPDAVLRKLLKLV